MGNLSVWVLVPTALRAHALFQIGKWRKQGYKIGLFIDPNHEVMKVVDAQNNSDLLITAQYPGVWQAWNILAQAALRLGADVCVLAGDDMDPDPKKNAEEIALEYLEHFPGGFGVMQPCGDMQGDLIGGVPNSGRICGSPWVGRQWIKRSYRGQGPVNGTYTAFYADEELKLVAERMGLLWMRPDLTQFHRHWSWRHLPKQDYHDRNQKSWEADRARFEAHRDNKFAGANPISETAQSC